jgi:hypothetical protein
VLCVGCLLELNSHFLKSHSLVQYPIMRRGGQAVDRRSFIVWCGCAGLSASALAGAALAESGPLIKLIFPFAAGGGGKTLCRILAQH